MKQAFLGILLAFQLISEIMGYEILSNRNDLNIRSEFQNENDEDLSVQLDDFVKELAIKVFFRLDYDKRVADLYSDISDQWINALKQRKLEPIIKTLHKTLRTIIVKTNNEDVRKILKVDDSILNMLDDLKSEKDTSKLFEEISNNPQLLFEGADVVDAYAKVAGLVNEKKSIQIERLLQNAALDERVLEVGKTLIMNFAQLEDENLSTSDVRKIVLDSSNYVIDSIANGKFESVLDALYDSAQLMVDNIDMNDPTVHIFLKKLLVFENILKQSVASVSEAKHKRAFLVRQLLRLK